MRFPGRLVVAITVTVTMALTFSAWPGTVQLLDGTVHEGAVSIDGGLLVRGAPSVKVALNNVLMARFSDEAPPAQCPRGLVLTNGTRIAGSFSSLAESIVQIEGKELRFPGRDIAWAVYHPFDSVLAADLTPGKTGALLPGGDFFEGSIKSADARSAKVLNPIFGPRVFMDGAKDLHAIVLRSMTPQQAAFEVITRDGSRYLALDLVTRDPGAVVLRHPHYDGLRVAAADLIEIRVAPSRALEIASLKPARVHGHYATTGPDGSMLRLGTQAIRGCSMAGGASATWKKTIRGGKFLARVAGGAEMPAGEKLIFVVEADGRVLFRSPPIGAGEAAHLIRCAVPAAESLTLRAEGAGAAQGIWADPVIVLR